MTHLLVIDVGSSSTRLAIWEMGEDGGRIVHDSLIRERYQLSNHDLGESTIDCQFLRNTLETSIDKICHHRFANSISAVHMATFAGNWIPLDEKQQPIAPIFTYADSRSALYKNQTLFMQHRTQNIHKKSGAVYHSSYFPSQFDWYQRHHSEQETAMISDFGGYCYSLWFGQKPRMSFALASWLGLLNRENTTWEPQWVDSLNLGDMLPELSDFNVPFQGLAPEYADRWQCLRDVPFFLAVGDGAAAQVGSGALTPDSATLTVGTTSAMRTVRKNIAALPEGCWEYRVDSEHRLIGAALNEGGGVYYWVKNSFHLSDQDIAKSVTRIPGSHGLTVVPLLNGERSPGWRGDASATIHGIRGNTSVLDIAHAFLEAVSLRIANIAQQLTLSPDTQVYASGGALEGSPEWAQLICDALGLPLLLFAEREMTLRGVAIMAQSALQQSPLLVSRPTIAKTLTPNMTYHQYLKSLRIAQNALYSKFYG